MGDRRTFITSLLIDAYGPAGYFYYTGATNRRPRRRMFLAGSVSQLLVSDG